MYGDYEVVLSNLYKLKLLDENTEEDIQETIGDCILDEEFEIEGYERLYEAAPFTRIKYSEDGECDQYFFASEDMTEYYRLAKKIGRLKGWKESDNPYLKDAYCADIRRLRKIDDYGSVWGNLYTKTNHQYASSWIIYVYCEFYDYWGLFFAIRDIFSYYARQVKRLRLEYVRLFSKQEMEVAA